MLRSDSFREGIWLAMALSLSLLKPEVDLWRQAFFFLILFRLCLMRRFKTVAGLLVFDALVGVFFEKKMGDRFLDGILFLSLFWVQRPLWEHLLIKRWGPGLFFISLGFLICVGQIIMSVLLERAFFWRGMAITWGSALILFLPFFASYYRNERARYVFK